MPSSLRPRLLRSILIGSIFAICANTNAQTLRPGGTARGVNRGTATTGRATGTGAGFGAGGVGSSSGPRQYRSNTLLGDALIQIDPETRSLVVVADEETHAELMKVIKDLDRPKPQVLIKVVFLEVTYDNSTDIGVEGSYTFNLESPRLATTGSQTVTSTTNGTSNNGATTTTSTSTLTTPLGQAATLGETLGASSLFGLASATDGSFVRVATDQWSATLRALAQKGKVEVLSRPSIMARNNQEAVIVVGQEVPFVTNSRVTDNGQTINTIQYDNVGIILRVTPFITANNMVEMIVSPEISNLTSQTVAISNTVSSPVIAKRSAETVIVTPNGSTAVIGGLMETQKIDTIRKIPILGDIPVLGFPFRRTITSDVKKELMIFLTPQIVHDPRTVEDVTSQELERTELVHKAFNEKDFEKFFYSAPPETRVEEETVTTDKEVNEPEVRRATAVKTTTTSSAGVSVKTEKAPDAPVVRKAIAVPPTRSKTSATR